MNTSGTDPWEMGPIIAAGTAVAIDTAREPEPERRPPAEPEPEPGPGLEPDARCVDDAGSEDRANTAVDPWEIGPLPSASNPVGNDIPADAPASEPQHVGGAVEPADLADTIDLTPVGDRDAAMPVREWRRMATTAGGILLAACVTVAGMSAWRSHESATAARELEQATADCATAHAAAKKAERKLVEYLDGDRLAQAKAVTADKLADPETLETLDKLAEQYSEGERIPACAATDTETASATTSKLQAIEKKHTGNLSRLKKAAGAVFSSRLAHTVDQGERLYSSSEGKVQDEYSRALLRASIDKRDEKAIADAMDKVNASIDAKTKADEERKAQEEAAAAAAAQAQSTPAPQQYSYTPSGSASGPGSGPTGGGYHSSGGSAGSTGGSASPGWSVPANPDPSQLPGTDPSLWKDQHHATTDHVDPVVRGTRHRPRVAGGRARRCRMHHDPPFGSGTFRRRRPRAAGEPGSLHAVAHHPVRHGNRERSRIVARAARRPVGRTVRRIDPVGRGHHRPRAPYAPAFGGGAHPTVIRRPRVAAAPYQRA